MTSSLQSLQESSYRDLSNLQESSYKDLTKLYTGKIQNRDPAICEIKPVRAFDTETREGNIFLVASQDNLGSRHLFNPTPDTLLRFLYNGNNRNSWNFFWNLTYDAEVILKLILGEELSSYKIKHRLKWKYNDVTISYIPTKSLSFSKGKHSCVFFDIAQFYNHASLKKAYEQNRTEQNRTEQNRTEQNRTEQNRTEQNRT